MKNLVKTTIYITTVLFSLISAAQNSLYIGPYSGSDAQGRLAVSGVSSELSLSNRAVTSFVNSPSLGERWVIYNHGTSTDGKLKFWSGGDKVAFTKEGRVGIGTTSPTSKLDIKVGSSENIPSLNFHDGDYKIGTIGAVGSADGLGLSIAAYTKSSVSIPMPTMVLSSFTKDLSPSNVYDAAVSVRAYNVDNSSTLQNLPIFTVLNAHSSAYLTVGADGNVGMGTASPVTKLDVAGNVGLGERLNNTSSYIGKYVGGTFGSNSNWIGFISSVTEDYLTFSTHKSGTSGGERMRIDPLGNVGIGTINPIYAKLQIRGGTTHQLFAVNRPDSDVPALYIGNDGSTNAAIASNNSNLTLGRDFAGTYTEYMRIQNSTGNVGIGTTDPLSKLSVNGHIRATEIKVLQDITVPDYVFEPDYELRTLEATKAYIAEHRHLPEIPSAAEIGENGIDVGDMNMRLLKKIEELTLHLIEQNERMLKMEKELEALKEE